MDSFAPSSSPTTMSSRSPSPATPAAFDSLENVTIADYSWSSHKTTDAASKSAQEDMLDLHDLIKEDTYEAPALCDFNALQPTAFLPPSFLASFPPQLSQSAPATHTLPDPNSPKTAPARPRKRDVSLSPEHTVIYPPKESCQGLPIILPSLPSSGTKSRVETQIRVTIDLAQSAPSSANPGAYDRIGSWQYLRLPKGTATKRRPRKEGRIAPKPEDTLYLRFDVTCASPPYTPVVSCSGCCTREAKRAAKKLALRVRPVRSDSESEEAAGPSHHPTEDEGSSIVQFNCPEVLEYSTGSAVLPVRMTCYCRHHREKVGFLIHFTMLDHHGRVVGSGVTPPIMITDDHKTSGPVSGKQVSPLVASPSAGPSSTPSEEPSNPKRKPGSKGTADSKKRAKPYDRVSKARKGSASGLASPVSLTSDLPETRAGSPLQLGAVSPISGMGSGLWPGQAASPVESSSAHALAASAVSLITGGASFLPTAPPSPAMQTLQPLPAAIPPSWLLYGADAPPAPLLPAPKIHRLIPSTGPAAGGIEITVLGAHFRADLEVKCVFGDVVASSTHRWSDNTLVCMLPPRVTSGVVIVTLEGVNDEDASPPMLFTYVDESDRALMELALQVVGLKMTGKIEDAKDVALRIVGNAGADNTQSTAMQVDDAPGSSMLADSTLAAQSLLFSQARGAGDFETLMINFLSVLDAPVQQRSPAALSHTSSTGQTLLHLASLRGFARLVRFLVGRGIDLDARDNNGLTALHFAALAGCKDCASTLVAAGADLEIVDARGRAPDALAPAGFFDDVVPHIHSESEWAEGEESDEEATWGDCEEEREDPARANVPRRRASRQKLDARPQDEKPGAPVDVKAPSYADLIQRALAQWQPQRGKDFISGISQLPPLPALPQLPALPPMPLVFPVLVPAFLNARAGEEPQRPGVKEWLALWEQWATQAMAAAQATQEVEDVPPPVYTPRTRQEVKEGPARRIGYRSEPVPEQDVGAYEYKPEKRQARKMKKKEDRMLVVFWIPMLFIGFWYTFFIVMRMLLHGFKTFLAVKTGIRI